MTQTAPREAVRLLRASVVLVMIVACSDRDASTLPNAIAPPATQPVAPPNSAVLRGTIDMTTGALEFEDVSPSAQATAAGGTRMVYGDQNVLVKLYNTPVALDVSVPGTKTWTGNVGLQNLTAHSIGDEQAGVAPDTSGVFVFFTSTPTVTAPVPCGGCTVAINTSDGIGNFSAPGQRYFWWKDRVAANDTTKARKTWSFSAPSAVTAFSFTVMVSAAWPPPAESRWKVTLNADSLPDTQEEPRWTLELTGTGNTYSASGGILTMNANSSGLLRFYRRDSVASTGSAYIEARMLSSSTNNNRPEARISIDDGVRFLSLGVARGAAWFTDAGFNFLAGTPATVTTTSYNVYQLRKYAADSVVFYVNNARRGAMAYAAFPTTAYAGTAPVLAFSNRGITGPSGGNWDYVIYEIGTPLP